MNPNLHVVKRLLSRRQANRFQNIEIMRAFTKGYIKKKSFLEVVVYREFFVSGNLCWDYAFKIVIL